MTRRATPIALALIVTALMLSGCGLPKDTDPRAIAPQRVPPGLLDPTTTKPGVGAAGAAVSVFFLAGDKLRSVSRAVPDVQAMDVLSSLIAGVADADPEGLTSAIPKNTQVLQIDTERSGVLVVTLSDEVLSITGVLQKTAFAQFVYTATSLTGVRGVRFRVRDSSGKDSDVSPTTDIGSKDGPLTRDDFSSLAP